MRVAIVCVCYHTHDQLLDYARSLRAALDLAPGVALDFVVVDTSLEPPTPSVPATIAELLPGALYLPSDNVGYFPGLQRGAARLGDLARYDYVAVSNVDLRVAPTFFLALSALRLPAQPRVGIVAPAIRSRVRQADSNPKTLTRPSRWSLRKNVFIFRHLWLFWLYQRLSTLKARVAPTYPSGLTFYSPHGSFIIFTRHFFAAGGTLAYPMFLFGEEDFVAEECRRIGATVRYQPEVVVIDSDHGSTSQQSQAFKAKLHAESLEYIIATYHS